jgi:hypothetical protein
MRCDAPTQGACTLEDFAAMLAPAIAAAGSTASWCAACSNTQATACVAAAAAAAPQVTLRRRQVSAMTFAAVLGVAGALGICSLALAARVAWFHARGRAGAHGGEGTALGLRPRPSSVWPHQQLDE